MPLLPTLAPEKAVPTASAPTAGGLPVRRAAHEPRRFRVLVIDDAPAIHEDIRKVLGPKNRPSGLEAVEASVFGTCLPVASDVEFEIDGALQAEAGVRRVEEAVAAGRRYAVAFVDMRMPPGDDGLHAILALWAVDPDIQVVICTAYSDYRWEEIMAETGETDQLVILRKPFENIEVLQLAHALSTKWEQQRALRRHVQNLEAQVTARTRELGEKQAVFRLILEHVADLIAVVDAHGQRIYNSPSYEAVLGYSPEELLRTHALAQVHPDDVGVVEHAMAEARDHGRGELAVYRMRHRDGTWRTLESRAGVVRGPSGEIAYLVIVARDISQRREVELKHQLGQKLESIGRLAAGIAHEINTPTQFITDNTRFLTDAFQQLSTVLTKYRARAAPSSAAREASGTVNGRDAGTSARGGGLAPASPSGPAAAEQAATEAEAELEYLLGEIPRALQQNLEGLARVSKIVRSLKEFSHPNSPDKAPVDLNRAIETAVAVCRHEWKYVADVVTEFDPTLPPVPCILDELNQVMLNLVVNAAHTIGEALKARGETRGIITIRTRAEGATVVVEVADTGMGIPSAYHGRIFEPFFTTKEVGKGTGQGLAIVHAVVVKHHQGAVDFTSEPGKGTTFRLRLPLSAAAPVGVTPS